MVQQFTITPMHIENETEKQPYKKCHQIKAYKALFQYNPRVNEPQSPFPDFNPITEMESVIANDIFKPLAFFLNYMFPFPDRIVYNVTTRRFKCIGAGLFRKLVCIVWISAILWRLCVKISPNSKGSSNTILTHVVKGSYVFFTIYCSLLFIQLWTKGQTFIRIFNQGIDVSSDLFLKFRCAPRSRLILLVTHSSWLFCSTFSFASHVIGGIIGIINKVTGNQNNSDMVLFGYDNVTDPNYSLNELDPQYPMFVHGLLIIANFLNTFNWMLSFFYLGTWALVYRQLFSIFFSRIYSMNQHGYELDLPKEIRTFNKIAALVDKYNAFSGLLVLWGAIVAILYISTSIEQVITGVQNIAQFSTKIYLFLSYVPIIITALMISELHRKACAFSDVIKQYYQQCKGVTCSRTTEALYGIALVHHDIVMSNIGFKGFSFFTVTYQFVVTMLSVIITYALVAIQWLPQLNQSVEMGQKNMS